MGLRPGELTKEISPQVPDNPLLKSSKSLSPEYVSQEVRQRSICDAGKEREVLDKGLMSAEVERTRYKNEARRARPAVVAVNASFSRPLPLLLLPPAEHVPVGVRVRTTRLHLVLSYRRLLSPFEAC